jgi:hypothetical protein
MHSGGKPSTDGFCGLFGARLKIFFWLPKKALAGEAVCKIRNAVYLKGYTAFCAQEQDVFAFNLFGRRRY